MPAPIASHVRKTLKTVAEKPHPQAKSKKTRAVRRRGRAQNGVESDEEIEREARTDSDTDDQSSLLSESESDSESLTDDDHPAGRFEVVTPSTTQSPPPLDIDGHATSSKIAPLTATLVAGESGPFVGATDWAQMVADENANGAGELPVIDFADLNNHAINEPVLPVSRTRKQQKHGKKAANGHTHTEPPASDSAQAQAPTTPTSRIDDQASAPAEEPVPSTSRSPSRERRPSRIRGQTPRQAYQQRLETDPSFVPKVGEFWGHDDRLLDKDLRSLSGWWRGRWQSRGRGRGAFGMRGRGGRGFFQGRSTGGPPEQTEGEADIVGPSDGVPVPPIERPWTHDGFEEMKQREEKRRVQQQVTTPQRGIPFRGRAGFFGARGRGGFARGGASPTPSTRQPFVPPPGRPWFAMKPEKVWTKHSETSLYFDHSLKPKQGQGPGYRVKLPGRAGEVVRTTGRLRSANAPSTSSQTTAGAAPTVASSEDGDRLFTVRIPRAGKEKASDALTPDTAPVEEAHPASSGLSIEEVFTVRPHAVPSHVPLTSEPLPSSQAIPSSSHIRQPSYVSSPPKPISHLPEPHAQQQLEQILVSPPPSTTGILSAQIEETVLRKPSSSDIHAPVPQASNDERQPPPILHPLQTTFSPVPPTSPPYGSPYAYGPVMPPGVAMSQHGIPYEIATGRAVYLQSTPPPAMFTPRPMMHTHMHHPSGSMSFVPTHMQHPSVSSPDFLGQPHTPPMNPFFDPSTGVPIFTPARQSSRIEIRAPTDTRAAVKPSGLRTTVTEDESTEPDYPAQPSDAHISDDAVEGQSEVPMDDQAVEPQMMPYQSYQQYYYPEPYGYAPYMEMPQQVMYQEMYPTEHRAPPPPPIIYY